MNIFHIHFFSLNNYDAALAEGFFDSTNQAP